MRNVPHFFAGAKMGTSPFSALQHAAKKKPPADPRAEIINLRWHTHANFTRIVLDVGVLREYSFGEYREPDRVYVDVLQAKLNPLLLDKTFTSPTDYLSRIKIAQKSASTVRLVVDVDLERIESYRVYHLFDPFRVIIDVYPKIGAPAGPATGEPAVSAPPVKPEPAAGAKVSETSAQGAAEAAKTVGETKILPPDKTAAATTPPPPPDKAPEPLAGGYSMARQLGLGVRTIVLDPGHGGRHPGCVGRSGLMEKDVTLDVALALRRLLAEGAGLDVVMTRESDIDVPLEDRTVIANEKRADLFVSIHVNAARNRKREGVESFYLNFTPDPDVNETAARENATTTRSIGQMKEILSKIVANSKSMESRELASRLHDGLVRALGSGGRPGASLGVKGGPFFVLIGGEMPSVLIEVSHMSNPRDEGLLKTAVYRERIARGLFDGIMAYLRTLGKG